MKRIMSFVLAAAIVISLAVPSLAAQKISNPGARGGIDGIDADPDIGMHNSYAWCSEVFRQDDSDYLWVGMNRDLGALLFGSTNSEMSLSMFGIPDASGDSAGRIYRQRVSDNAAEWEMVYKNDGVSGYRKMIVFNGDLYVLAGLSNRRSLTQDYSVVLRFPAGFKTGDAPDIVFWENVTGTTTEYFRSAAVLGDKLYIGTFDSKIYSTDGGGLRNLTPNAGEKGAGWSLAVNLRDEKYGVRSDGAIWDLLAFNNYLYAFVAHVGDAYQPGNAFGVYKIAPDGNLTPDGGYEPSQADDGYSLEQIVGGGLAPYPYGLGVGKNQLGFGKNMTASGFLSTSFDKEYVYVTTFANGPLFLGAMAMGNYEAAFNNLFCPAQIYRFDENDRWEVVVGDDEGELVAVDANGAKLPRVSAPDQRAGFFLQDYNCQNVSFNQYIWWMAEHEGKLYASTWDMSVFKQYYSLLSLMVFNDITDGALMSLLGGALSIEEALQTVIVDYESVDVRALAGELGAYLQEIKDSLCDDGFETGCDLPLDEIVGGFIAIINRYFPLEDTRDLTGAIYSLATASRGAGLEPRQVVTDTLAYVSATALFFLDKSNPAGFDLYVSDDGMNFAPVTVDGFGDPCNYGGRVLTPSAHGMYVATANPFNGGQVWRLDAMGPGVYPNGPSQAHLGTGDRLHMTALVTDATTGCDLELAYSSEIAEVRFEKRETIVPVTDVTWDNEIICKPLTGRRTYKVTESSATFDTVMYDVFISPVKSGSEDLVLNFSAGGAAAVWKIALTVDAEGAGEPVVVNASPSAFVEKFNGDKNMLYITVVETYSDGSARAIEWSGLIDNNAAGIYDVGGYDVYVDTKGNTQIRACYIAD